MLNGVLDFTGKDNLQYVGFSNGCRVALDSLERGQFDSNKVETFVAVGCPGSFEGESTMGSIIKSRNGQISKNLASRNANHPSFGEVAVVGDVEVRNLAAALALSVEFGEGRGAVEAENERTTGEDDFFEKFSEGGDDVFDGGFRVGLETSEGAMDDTIHVDENMIRLNLSRLFLLLLLRIIVIVIR